jgi:hypothetical protein
VTNVGELPTLGDTIAKSDRKAWELQRASLSGYPCPYCPNGTLAMVRSSYQVLAGGRLLQVEDAAVNYCICGGEVVTEQEWQRWQRVGVEITPLSVGRTFLPLYVGRTFLSGGEGP